MTSPYTYSGVASIGNQIAETEKYRDFLTRTYQQMGKKYGARSAQALPYYQRLQQIASQSHTLQKQLASYTNKWIAGGRVGADEAVAKRYTTPEQIAAKLQPFDPQGGVEALSAKRTLDQNLINLTSQQNILEQQYGTSKRDYEAKVPELARQLLSGYSGRGMAFSSGYGNAVGEQNADIARGLSGLDLQRQQGLADITSQQGLAQTGYKNDLASSLVGTVNRLSSRAGTLGYGPKGRDIYNDPTLLSKLAQKLLGAK